MGPSGVQHFKEIERKHGRIDAVWYDGPVPHAVHFREGMAVRNKLRRLKPNQGDHWYDDHWVGYIERAIG